MKTLKDHAFLAEIITRYTGVSVDRYTSISLSVDPGGGKVVMGYETETEDGLSVNNIQIDLCRETAHNICGEIDPYECIIRMSVTCDNESPIIVTSDRHIK